MQSVRGGEGKKDINSLGENREEGSRGRKGKGRETRKEKKTERIDGKEGEGRHCRRNLGGEG